MLQITVGAERRKGAARLRAAGIASPELDAALLLAEAMGLTREALFLRENDETSAEQRSAFAALLERRLGGESIALIRGFREFFGLDFVVNTGVLCPRPETELLVEKALEWIAARSQGETRLLDLCTGSGAVAIAVKHSRHEVFVAASDISPEAIETAKINARRLSAGEIVFYQADLFEGIPGQFDIITANPPYIPTGCLAGLPPEVRLEPRLALDGGQDGLSLIRRIVSGAAGRLGRGGRLLLEIGDGQASEAAALFRAAGFHDIETYRDLGGTERVICAFWHSQ
jgi:release factor glutamine methyltransferase